MIREIRLIPRANGEGVSVVVEYTERVRERSNLLYPFVDRDDYKRVVNFDEPVYVKVCQDKISFLDERKINNFDIEKVIYNYPATIVIWKDGTKTVVKCQEGDMFDFEKGLAMCFAKKALGNKGNFNDVLRKHIPTNRSIIGGILDGLCKVVLNSFYGANGGKK